MSNPTREPHPLARTPFVTARVVVDMELATDLPTVLWALHGAWPSFRFAADEIQRTEDPGVWLIPVPASVDDPRTMAVSVPVYDEEESMVESIVSIQGEDA